MKSSSQQPREKLRSIVARRGFTMVPGAVDPLTARQIELAGFEAVYLTGGGFSRAQGLPDIGLLTMTEITQWVGRVVAAVGIPVIVDADTGYGNALNVIRAVQEFERTGAAAIHLEDQVFPKRCGHYEGKQVVSRQEMVSKIKAAADTRNDDCFLLIARTDARAVHGLDDAIDRMHAYMGAGADIAFVEAPQSVTELQEIPRRLPGVPLLVNIFEGGKTPVVKADDLQAMGYRLGIYPSQAHRAAIHAVRAVLQKMRANGGLLASDVDLLSFAEREALVASTEWQQKEHEYVRSVGRTEGPETQNLV